MKRLAPLLLLSLLACRPDEVDETGYLQPPEIEPTSEEELEEETTKELLVVGHPGAVSASGGILTVAVSSGDTASVQVDDPSGSFVVVVDALLGDTIALDYELDGNDSLELGTNGAASVEAPSCITCIGDTLFTPPDAEGNTSVLIESLANPMPPYTVMNLNRGLALSSAAADAVLKVPAASGEKVCLYRSDASSDLTSRSHCEVLP